MASVEKVVKALEEKLDAARGGYAELTMKANGDEVWVNPSFNGFEVYFSEIGRVQNYANLTQVAEMLIAYPKAVNDMVDEEERYRNEEIPKLRKFYKEHIEGHTDEEFRIGSDFAMAIYDMWASVPAELKEGVSYIFDEKLHDFYIGKYVELNPQYNAKQLESALNLSNDYSFYSDWHKDVYGYRPH